MPVQTDPEVFEIKVKINVPIGNRQQEVVVSVDLSRPEFEKQVLAAAGRFQALKRRSLGGGKPPIPVKCPGCDEQFPSLSAYKGHICQHICPHGAPCDIHS